MRFVLGRNGRRLVDGIEGAWDKSGLSAELAEDVARVIAGGLTDSGLLGESEYVEGEGGGGRLRR